MPVSDATKPEQAAMTADAPMASISNVEWFARQRRREEEEQLDELSRRVASGELIEDDHSIF